MLPAVVGVLHQQQNGKNTEIDSHLVRSLIFILGVVVYWAHFVGEEHATKFRMYSSDIIFFKTTILVNGILPAVVGVLHLQRNGKTPELAQGLIQYSVFHSWRSLFTPFTLLVKHATKFEMYSSDFIFPKPLLRTW